MARKGGCDHEDEMGRLLSKLHEVNTACFLSRLQSCVPFLMPRGHQHRPFRSSSSAIAVTGTIFQWPLHQIGTSP
eukprot:1902257-Rhodomonas_salina.4